jgi:hypothetical protein
LESGDVVRFYGFTEGTFNDVFTVDAASTTNKIVVAVAYVAETMTSSQKRRKVLSLGTGGDCPDVVEGLPVTLEERHPVYIRDIDEASKGAGTGKVELTSRVGSRNVSCVSPLQVRAGKLETVMPLTEGFSVSVRPSPGTDPTLRSLGGDCVVPHLRKMYTMNGRLAVPLSGGLKDVTEIWEYDIDDDTWELVETTGDAGLVMIQMHAWYIPAERRILFTGLETDGYGNKGTPPVVNMMWFDPVNRTLEQIQRASVPTTSDRRAADYDPVNHRIWSFGGDIAAIAESDLLFYFDIETLTWTEVTQGATKPPARIRAHMTYEPGHGLLLFGGATAAGAYYGDLWRYDIASGEWEQLSPSGSMIAMAHGAHSFEVMQGRWYIYGGVCSGGTGYNPDLYYYDIGRNEWVKPSFTGGPYSHSHTTRQPITLVDGKSYLFHANRNSESTNQVIVWDFFTEGSAERSGVALTSGDGSVDASECIRVQVSSVQESKGTGAAVYYAVSWDGKTAWKICVGGAWVVVAMNDGGTWKYRNGSGVLVAADENTVHGALLQAMGVSGNRMDYDDVLAVTDTEWDAAAVAYMPCAAFDIAVVLESSADGLARVFGWEVDRTQGIDLRSTVQAATEDLFGVGVSVLAKGDTESLWVYAGRSGGAEWTELGSLTKGADLASDVEHWGSDLTELEGTGTGLVLRARMDGDAEIHGWAGNWVPRVPE